jgi:hypothetical protein
MILLIIFLWGLSGFASYVGYYKWYFKEVTIGDLVSGFFAGFFGPFVWIIIIHWIIEDSDLWDKKIF